jgi:Flp pilus assembly protein TadD
VALLPGLVGDLGLLLYETGVIDRPTFDASLYNMAESGLRYGDTLVAMGAITETQLAAALKLQLTRRVVKLFGATPGTFAVYAEEHSFGRGSELKQMGVSARRLIYRGIRSAYDDTRLAREAPGLGAGPVLLKPAARDAVTDYGFEPEALAVVGALERHAWTRAELVTATGQDDTLVGMILYTLQVTDALAAGVAPERGADPSGAETGRPGTYPPARPGTYPPARPGTYPPARPGTWPPDRPRTYSPDRPGTWRPDRPRTDAPDRPATYPPDRPRTDALGGLDAAAAEAMAQLIEAKARGLESQTFFEVLELQQTASGAEVRSAFVRLQTLYRTDRLRGPGLEHLRVLGQKILTRLTEAHGLLQDDERRRQYVALLRDASPQGGAQASRLVEAQLAYQRGSALLDRNDFAGAERELRRAVEMKTDDGQYLALCAFAAYHAASDKHAAAPGLRTMLTRAARLAPQSVEVHLRRGEVLLAEGDLQPALTSFRQVLSLSPDHVEATRAARLIAQRLARQTPPVGLLDRLRRK